jgi:glyoxylase-like metal-dependent hydrolase (beta-lactamase superfamily II)
MTGPGGPAAPVTPGRLARLSPLVCRLTQDNPGPFTGPGTNTHLVGAADVVILDPGEDRDDGHLERIVAAVAGARVLAVVPSHGHDDHWTLAPRLARRLGAPLLAGGPHPGFRADGVLADGDVLGAGDARLEVLHTPGHTPDHLCFLLPAEGALFPGDHVMGWSTSVIAPPEGHLPSYQRSLERLLALPGLRVLYPAHGPAVTAPYERMRELHRHREARTRQALAALAAGPDRLLPLVRRIYADVDPAMHPAAAQSLLAHLLALEEEGRAARDGADPAGATWRLAER